jgi:hypothetical protein
MIAPFHVEGMRKLLTYLTEDCCEGLPELCGSGIKKAPALCRSKEAHERMRQ